MLKGMTHVSVHDTGVYARISVVTGHTEMASALTTRQPEDLHL